MTRWVLHVDMDQFIAAVEILRRPELRGQPVVVGGDGDPGKRGVVSTASYEARVFGVRSGMALRLAFRKCPQAIFLPVDAPAYDAVSARVMAALRGMGRVVEVLGWDEAFVAYAPPTGVDLAAEPSSRAPSDSCGGAPGDHIGSSSPDLSDGACGHGSGGGCGDFVGGACGDGFGGGSRDCSGDDRGEGFGDGGPWDLARQIQARVTEATGLSCSVGIGDNRLQAKLATGFGKPAGIFQLTSQNWFDVLGDRGTEALWGIGAKTAKRLAALGIRTVRELAAADPAELARQVGPATGPWLVSLGRGLGSAEVSAQRWVPRSMSHETTFQQDITDWVVVRDEVAKLARRVAQETAAQHRLVTRAVVKVRFVPFTTRTRGQPLAEPTTDPALIEAAALAALERFPTRRPVRLLGLRADLAPR